MCIDRRQLCACCTAQCLLHNRAPTCLPACSLSCPCRVRLPRNGETAHGVVLGEGKPENQNAAIIFCFGEVVQVGALLLQGAPRWWRV